ncbi:MAG: thioesterase family protein [Mariprofundus sp.]|nr:thioesterase family protein [Mariprofundus sp.]
MKKSASIDLEIPFHDIDILGIAWHGHYYKYFELARTALFRSFDFDIAKMKAMGYIFPVIESQCRYVRPLSYGQQVQVCASLDKHISYLLISYTIIDIISGKRVAYGHTKQAACHQDGSMLLAIPDEVIHAIFD